MHTVITGLEKRLWVRASAVYAGGPEFRSQHPPKEPGMAMRMLCEVETEGLLKLAGHQGSPRFSERYCLKGIRRGDERPRHCCVCLGLYRLAGLCICI